MRHLKQFCAAILFFGIFVDVSAQDIDQYFEAEDGTSIHYKIYGEGVGVPVILVHGYISNMEHMWTETIPLLKNDFQVINIDARGHGLSGKPQSSTAYGKIMYRDIVELMEYLEIEKAHFVGYSMGAMIGLRMVVDHPDRIISLVLGGNGMFESAQITSIGESYIERLSRYNSMEEALEDGFFSPPDEIKDDFIDHLKQSDIETMIIAVKSFDQFAVTKDEAEKIKVPMAVILGENDVAMSTAIHLLESNRRTRIIPIPDRSHLDAFYDPEFGIQVKRFLDDVERIRN